MTVRERPITYSTADVIAKIANIKTQTRRLIKIKGFDFRRDPLHGFLSPSIRETHCCTRFLSEDILIREFCPYGQIGDILWAKETWGLIWAYEDSLSDWEGRAPKVKPDLYWGPCYSAAGNWESQKEDRGFRWRPPGHMPRWASRILEKIIEIRVQQLQDISITDIRAEGVPETYGEYLRLGYPEMESHIWDNMTAKEQFAMIWDRNNGAGSWNRNDYVWAITTSQVKQ